MFYPLKFVHKYKCVTMMLLSSSIVTHAIVSDNILKIDFIETIYLGLLHLVYSVVSYLIRTILVHFTITFYVVN